MPGIAKYQGGFRNSGFFDEGTLQHLDSGSKFEGNFLNHHKHGPGKLTLASGHVYKGNFRFNSSCPPEDFGPRF